ncbi:E3 ubiquitin-protein ligase makorin-like isoform X1 [Musa acuminata AAA Group]|uniref:E3 ubiquitin-protein ligase makorin-like isoform X1 n=1 Tax=Musa acuminata AAA Group TaxID=214697 RepID=UPI0031D8A377
MPTSSSPLPSMPRRILCKYFARGTCLKGEYCEFSHDWRDQSNNVCNFYQRGLCTYGSRCRYNHIGVSSHNSCDPASSISHQSYHVESSSSQFAHPPRASLKGETSQAFRIPVDLPVSCQSHTPPLEHAQKQKHGADISPSNEGSHVPAHMRPADSEICALHITGSCLHGKSCPDVHGDMCSICEMHCLHPFHQDKREEHITMCQKNNKLHETTKYSQEIECSICLERVLSKPTDAERKFGILSECDHPFCISCIRNWRRNSPASGIDLDTALRACPVCRKHSYFVVPSVTWFTTKEEKQEIITSYKDKLKLIDCKYFDFGNGTCPFGASCFYKHTYKPHANRRSAYRPRRNRPHPHRSRQIMEREEIEDFINPFALEDELANLAALLDVDEEESEDLDEEDFGSLLLMHMSFLLVHMDDEELLSDDDN